MNYILFDGTVRNNLLPFTFTRPVADIRIGILTVREKWETYLQTSTSTLTENYLSEKFPIVEKAENICVNASFLPNKNVAEAIKHLQKDEVIFYNNQIVAYYTQKPQEEPAINQYKRIEFKEKIIQIENIWDIFAKNGEALQNDFNLLTSGRKSEPIPTNNNIISPENIFIEKGAKVQFCTLNASTGPIYIGKNAEIMEGSIIRGGFALCEGSQVKMGAKIYGPTTVGPHSKIGGEVNNSVIFGYSNKGHDGFLGNSVIGEWCNIGADTNNSNLKNNYAEVRLWNYQTENFAKTGLQFCGLLMGDHSKCGINTMFNTATVVGVSANIFGGGFPRTFIPSFSWGGANGFTSYKTEKAFEASTAMMKRRSIDFTEEDKAILEHVFEITKKWRNY